MYKRTNVILIIHILAHILKLFIMPCLMGENSSFSKIDIDKMYCIVEYAVKLIINFTLNQTGAYVLHDSILRDEMT